jgi:hypothetical protein
MRSYVSTASLLEKDRLVHFGEEIEWDSGRSGWSGENNNEKEEIPREDEHTSAVDKYEHLAVLLNENNNSNEEINNRVNRVKTSLGL